MNVYSTTIIIQPTEVPVYKGCYDNRQRNEIYYGRAEVERQTINSEGSKKRGSVTVRYLNSVAGVQDSDAIAYFEQWSKLIDLWES